MNSIRAKELVKGVKPGTMSVSPEPARSGNLPRTLLFFMSDTCLPTATQYPRRSADEGNQPRSPNTGFTSAVRQTQS